MSTATNNTSIATNFDLPSLHLLLDEIKVALKDSEVHLSEFHEDAEQAPLLLDSQTVIRQLSLIFQLIDFKGASELADLIAQSLAKLHDSGDNTQTALIMDISEAIMVLDRYVELVLLKQVLEPALLLPIINKLRAQLGQDALTQDALEKSQVVSIANPEQFYAEPGALVNNLEALLGAYRAGLAVILTGNATSDADRAALLQMHNACQQLAQNSGSLFWQAAATLTRDIANELPLTVAKKRVLIYIEQQFQHYLPLNDRRFADLISQAAKKDAQFATLAKSEHSKNKGDTQQLQKFLFGPNREITDTLNTLIQAELGAIKENIDGLIRKDPTIGAPALPDIVQKITNLAKAMKLLGLNDANTALQAAAQKVQSFTDPTPEDFDALLQEMMVGENAAITLAKHHTPGAVKLPLHNKNISLHQLDTAYDALIKESRNNLSMLAGAAENYLNDSARDPIHLQNLPEMLAQVAGAANFLNMPKTATMLHRLARIVTDKAITNKQKPSDAFLANMADVIAAADYQFEGQEFNRPISKQAMLIGQHSLNRLLSA